MWAALPTDEKERKLAFDWRRQEALRQLRDAITGNEKGGPMDAAWAVLLALEML